MFVLGGWYLGGVRRVVFKFLYKVGVLCGMGRFGRCLGWGKFLVLVFFGEKLSEWGDVMLF